MDPTLSMMLGVLLFLSPVIIAIGVAVYIATRAAKRREK